MPAPQSSTHDESQQTLDSFDGMEDRKQVCNDLTSSFTIKHIGGVYPDDEHATDCIDNDRTFSSLNRFAPTKSRFYIEFRGSLDALTINNCSRWIWLSVFFLA